MWLGSLLRRKAFSRLGDIIIFFFFFLFLFFQKDHREMYLVDLLAVIRSEKPTSTDSAHPYQILGAKEGLLLRRLQVGLAARRLNG